MSEGYKPTQANGSEKETSPASTREELLHVIGSEDAVQVDSAIEVLTQELKDAPVVGRSLTAIKGKEFVIPVTSAEQKTRVLEALYDLNIFPWEDQGVLVIENSRDMQKMRLAGFTDEALPTPPVMHAAASSELSFPLERHDTLSEHLKGEIAQRKAINVAEKGITPKEDTPKKIGTQESVESGVDTELQDLIHRFDQGLIDEDDEEFKSKIGVFPTLTLFPRQYVWQKGNPVEKHTGKIISKEERIEIIKRAQEGDVEALNTVVRMSTGLVFDAVVRLKEKFGGDADDLFQEGLMGLVRAVKTYDPDKGAFSTYAMYPIENRIRRFAYDYRFPITRSPSLQEKQRNYRKTSTATGSEVSGTQVGDTATSYGKDRLERSYMLNAVFNPISDDGRELMEESFEPVPLQSEVSRGAPDTVFQKEISRVISQTLLTLTPREERVIRMRFGLGGTKSFPQGQIGAPVSPGSSSDGMTLDEVAKEFNVGRERIRQIEAKALRKLKQPSRSRALKELLKIVLSDSEGEVVFDPNRPRGYY